MPLQTNDNPPEELVLSPVAGAELAAQIVTTWLQGGGALPHGLGLDEFGFQQLLACYFVGLRLPYDAPSGLALDESRLPERAELERLLRAHKAGVSEVEELWIQVLVAGINGNNHLWEDMGFNTRADLSRFMQTFFPQLAEKNTQNMKWKKFIYKQMCLAEEIGYTCRSPSCEVCTDYQQCFDLEQGFWP